MEAPLPPSVLAARNKEMKIRLSTSSLVLGGVGRETRDWSLSSTQRRHTGLGALDPELLEENLAIKKGPVVPQHCMSCLFESVLSQDVGYGQVAEAEIILLHLIRCSQRDYSNSRPGTRTYVFIFKSQYQTPQLVELTAGGVFESFL